MNNKEFIKIKKYYIEGNNSTYYDIRSIRDEFDTEIEELERHNSKIDINSIDAHKNMSKVSERELHECRNCGDEYLLNQGRMTTYGFWCDDCWGECDL